jgi:hypothetical protein
MEELVMVQQRNYGELQTFSTYMEEQLVEALTRLEAVGTLCMCVCVCVCAAAAIYTFCYHVIF